MDEQTGMKYIRSHPNNYKFTKYSLFFSTFRNIVNWERFNNRFRLDTKHLLTNGKKQCVSNKDVAPTVHLPYVSPRWSDVGKKISLQQCGTAATYIEILNTFLRAKSLVKIEEVYECKTEELCNAQRLRNYVKKTKGLHWKTRSGSRFSKWQ